MKENRFYIYIDESGSFKGSDHSFVGGFITTTPPKELCHLAKQAWKQFKQKYPKSILTLEDIHCSELLHAETIKWKDKEKTDIYKNIALEERQAFISYLKNLLDEHALYVIQSKNEKMEFGEENKQSRYGACLGALFQEFAQVLENYSQGVKFKLSFLIARRNAVCLPKHYGSSNSYHKTLTQYFLNLCAEANLDGKELEMSFKEKQLLLDLADVTCYHLREDSKQPPFDKGKIRTTKPNQINFSAYADHEQKSIEILIEKKELSSAYRLSQSPKQQKMILDQIRLLEGAEQVEQIRYFLNLAHLWVDRRTLEKELLSKAKTLFRNIYSLKEHSKSEKIANLITGALNGLILCANHSGETLAQESFLKDAQEQIEKQAEKSPIVRYTEILELRNRAYNDQFNNYEFESVIDNFEDIVLKYESLLKDYFQQNSGGQNNRDYLAHKLFSTIGQAYGFLSATSKDWSAAAEQAFEKSLAHFFPELKDKRTPNYLATLYWYHQEKHKIHRVYENYLPQAKSIFESSDSIKELGRLWQNDVIDVFDVLVALRFCIENYKQCQLNSQSIKELENIIQTKMNEEHPYELIYKWLGIGRLQLDDTNRAIQHFEKAMKYRSDFTIETIALSCHALKIYGLEKQNAGRVNDEWKKFEEHLKQLTAKSSGFSSYIMESGGLEMIKQYVYEAQLESLSRFLPFSYS